MKFFRWFMIALPLCCLSTAALAQQSAVSQPTGSDKWKAYYLERASQDYELILSEEGTPLVLREKPIVNWTNPLEKGQINGSTFVWENDGRPVAVGQLFSYLINSEQRSFCNVFSTLSDRPLTGRRKGEVFWEPQVNPKTSWQAAKNIPAPARNRSGRLLQMRRIARQVTSFTEEESRGKRKLRLLPQPLYRSDETANHYECGLFAFVVGTDPELLLLIETDLSDDAPAWRYRFVQSTRSTTIAAYGGEEAYRYDSEKNNPRQQDAVYLSQHGVEVIPADFD